MRLSFSWNRPVIQIAKERTGDAEGLLFLANEAKRLMDPYVPADNLVLAQNVRVYVENDTGIVHYISPYAHYQWEGEKYVDPKTGIAGFIIPGVGWRSRSGTAKKPSGRPLEYSRFRHPLAASHWDKAMITARKGDLTKLYQNYMNGGRT